MFSYKYILFSYSLPTYISKSVLIKPILLNQFFKEPYSILCFSINSSVLGYLLFFKIWAIVNNAAYNIGVQISFLNKCFGSLGEMWVKRVKFLAF